MCLCLNSFAWVCVCVFVHAYVRSGLCVRVCVTVGVFNYVTLKLCVGVSVCVFEGLGVCVRSCWCV